MNLEVDSIDEVMHI